MSIHASGATSPTADAFMRKDNLQCPWQAARNLRSSVAQNRVPPNRALSLRVNCRESQPTIPSKVDYIHVAILLTAPQNEGRSGQSS